MVDSTNIAARFQMALGSVIGREHQRIGKNNQDAVLIRFTPQYGVAVVCDGCGSGSHSEVGSWLGARLLVNALEQGLRDGALDWTTLLEDVLNSIETLLPSRGRVEMVQDFFLFTVVGCVITPEQVTLFSLGDGVMIVNGEVRRLGPFPGNAPPYLGYGLLGSGIPFQVWPSLPTAELDSLLIGSDGVMELIDAAERQIPGLGEKVGSIDQFWIEDRYFENPDRIRRRLALINREVTRPLWSEHRLRKEVGLLPDDTTFVVIRGNPSKKPEPKGAWPP